MGTAWNQIHPQDILSIEKTSILSSKDVKRLADFYLPIIGPEAYTLYQMLFVKEEVRVSVLLNELSIGLRDYHTAKSRLEALGLLRIYQSRHEAHHLIYQLLLPLTAEGFLGDDLLRALLTERIGDQMLEKIYKSYQVAEISDAYDEITQTFQDVFEFDVSKVQKLEPLEINSLQTTTQNLSGADVLKQARLTFDFKFYLDGLDRHFVKKGSIDESIQKIVATYHLLYGLNELEMQQLTIASADIETGVVSKKRLTHELLSFVKKNKQRTVSIDEPTTDVSHQLPEPLIQLIQHAEKTPPGQYLQSIKEQKNGFVTSDEGWILNELTQQSNLTTGAINILLHYILVVRNEPTLNKTYALKIANDWVQSQVTTAEQAVLKVQSLYEESSKKQKTRASGASRYSNRRRQTETLPDWWGKEVKKDTASLSTPAESSNNLMERLENIRKQSQDGVDES